MKKIVMYQKPPLVEKPIFIDAHGRSGKYFVCRLLSGFDQVEYFQSVTVLDHIHVLWDLKKISEDAAVSWMQSSVDEHVYYMHIGRYLNLRYDDGSCINNSEEPQRYLRRALAPISKTIVQDIKKEGRRNMFALHSALEHIDIFFKTFPDLQWINLIRHPVDVIHSWYIKGYSRRHGRDPLIFAPLVQSPQGSVPFYAYEWGKSFEQMPEMDRIIKTIVTLHASSEAAYRDLGTKRQKQVCTVIYENILGKSHEELKRIGAFLGVPVSERMAIILAREKCPSPIDVKKRKAKIEEIKRLCSKKSFEVMMAMATDYEKSYG